MAAAFVIHHRFWYFFVLKMARL